MTKKEVDFTEVARDLFVASNPMNSIKYLEFKANKSIEHVINARKLADKQSGYNLSSAIDLLEPKLKSIFKKFYDPDKTSLYAVDQERLISHLKEVSSKDQLLIWEYRNLPVRNLIDDGTNDDDFLETICLEALIMSAKTGRKQIILYDDDNEKFLSGEGYLELLTKCLVDSGMTSDKAELVLGFVNITICKLSQLNEVTADIANIDVYAEIDHLTDAGITDCVEALKLPTRKVHRVTLINHMQRG